MNTSTFVRCSLTALASFALFSAAASAARFEAESGILTNTTISTDIAGYSGAGYVTGFTTAEAQVEIPVTVDKTGSYELDIVYAAVFGDKNTRLWVNGSDVGEVTLPTSATFASAEGPTATLQEGENTIRFESNWGYYEIDAIDVAFKEPPTGLLIEAESGALHGVEVSHTRSGFSGTGYVTGFDAGDDSIDLPVTIDKAGDYIVNVIYAAESGDKNTRLFLNGADLGEVTLVTTSSFALAKGPIVSLEAGANLFTVSSNWGYYDIDALLLEFVPPYASAYEAEEGTLTGGVSVATNRAGYSGTGYATGFAAEGDAVDLTLNLLLKGDYQISLRYAAPFGDKNTRLQLDGADLGEVPLPASNEWAQAGGPLVRLENGLHDFTVLSNWGYYDIDRVDVDYVLPPVALEFEAESGTTRGTRIAAVHSGYSGTGYVTGFTVAGNSVDIPMNVAEDGNYRLYVRYATPFGPKNTRVFVNGSNYGEVSLPDSADFAETSGPIASLTEGLNIISFETSWGFYEIDSIRLEAVPPPEFAIDQQPIDEYAAPETLALYRYLLNSFGETILSGQTEQPTSTPEVEMEYILANTGKLPAIRNMDLLPYSAVGGWDDGLVERAIEWHREHNGIISMQWHWFAPSGGDSFYTAETTFDITKAIDPSQPEYAEAIADIDAIAEVLGELAANRVPVIFRPLHEAEGGWFWWGAHGPGPAIELYKIMYHRLTDYHGLHNIVWVWNSVAEEWYPGNEYVDIVSFDVYREAGDYELPPSPYLELAALSNNQKLITLAENGPIPDIDLLIQTDTLYSSFAPWWGDYITDGVTNDLDHLNEVYHHEAVITRDELPELRVEQAVQLFSGKDFNGLHVELPVGSYDAQALAVRGIEGGTVQSVRAPAGYVVVLFEGPGFTGKRAIAFGNRKNLPGGGNRAVGSVKVYRIDRHGLGRLISCLRRHFR